MQDTNERWEQLHKLANFAPAFPTDSVIRWTFRSFPRGQRRKLLDVGAGHGRHALFWAQQGHDAVATDVSSAAMDACATNAAQLGLAVRCEVAPAGSLPFPDATFDGILSHGVLCYAPWHEWEGLFAEVHRLLKPEGKALLVLRSTNDSRCATGTAIGSHEWRVEAVADCPWATEVGMPMTFVDEADVQMLAAAFDYVTIDSLRFSDRGGRFWNDDLLVQLTK